MDCGNLAGFRTAGRLLAVQIDVNSGDRCCHVTVKGPSFPRVVVVVVSFFSFVLLAQAGIAATINPPPPVSHPRSRGITESPRTRRHMRHLARSRAVPSRSVTALKRHHYYEHFYASSYSSDITDGDVTVGEDPDVRQAASDGIGNMK